MTTLMMTIGAASGAHAAGLERSSQQIDALFEARYAGPRKCTSACNSCKAGPA